MIPIYAICQGILTDVLPVPRSVRIHRNGAPVAFWVIVSVYFLLAMLPLASTAVLLRFGSFRRTRGGR